jgi:hypothetical protein
MSRGSEINMFWLVRRCNDHDQRWVVRDRYVALELVAAYLQRGDMLEIEDDEVEECVAVGSGDELFEPSAYRSFPWPPHNDEDYSVTEVPDCGYDIQGSSGVVDEPVAADSALVTPQPVQRKRKYAAVPQQQTPSPRNGLQWLATHE